MAEATGTASERRVAFPPLMEAAHPDLYRRNAFRVTGLPVDASGREVTRRADRLKLMEKLATPGGDGRGALALHPPPDSDAIREALRRLHDPEDRIVDELFWFWPAERSAVDPALQALAQGDLETAQRIWQEQDQAGGDAALAARHDLAVLAHLQALEAEEQGASDGTERRWEEAIRRWRRLVEDPGLGERLRARLVELSDPRLTPEHVDGIVCSLPQAVLSVSAELAAKAAESAALDAAARHVRHLELWDAPAVDEAPVPAPAAVAEALRCAVCEGPVELHKLVGQVWCPACKKTVKAKGGPRKRKGAAVPKRSALVADTLHRVLEPQRQRIKTLCTTAEAEADRDPVHADALVGRLLEQTTTPLRVLDTLLEPGDLVREAAHDDVALKALACQIAYGNKTQDWRRCALLLGPVLATASSAATKQRVQDNLDIVRKNAETGGDWCAAGYYDLPAPVLEIAERARARAETQQWEESIGPLVGVYMGRACGELPERQRAVVGQALASALNKRSMAKLKPAMAIAQEPPWIIGRIAERAGRGDHGFVMTAMAARMGIAGNADVEIHCMACGSRIYSRFFKFTFKDIPVIVCPDCNSRDDRERDGRKGRMREAMLAAAEDLVVAADLAPDDTAVRENLDALKKLGSDIGTSLPSVHRTRMRLGLAGTPELLKALSQGSSDDRARAAEALGHGQDPASRAIPALIHALADGDKDVRQAATTALGRQGALAAAALAAALDHDKAPVREGAAEALKALGAVAADEITFALRHDHARVRALACAAAVGLGKAAVPSLLMVLHDPESAVREAALNALGAIRDPRAIGPLVRLLADPEAGLAAVAPAALALIDADWARSEGAREALPDLVAALAAEQPKARRAAAQALGALGPAAATAGAALATALRDPHKEVRAAAADALGALADPAAIPLLAALLADRAGAVARAAQQALARIDADWAKRPAAIEAVPDLARGLQGPDPAARLACVSALQAIGQPARTAGLALVAALRDADAEVREAVAAALPVVCAPSPAAVRGLAHLLADPVVPPRRAAARALGAMAGHAAGHADLAASLRTAGPALAEAAAKDADERVRALAFEALEKVDPALARQVVRRRWRRRLVIAAAVAAGLALFFFGGLFAAYTNGDPLATRLLHGAGLVRPEHARPVYVAALESSDSTWRVNGAWGLGALGADAAPHREALLRLRLDPEYQVRRAAEDALARMGEEFVPGPADAPIFLKALGEQGTTRRAIAARAIGELGPAAKDAVPGLMACRDDPEQPVREAVREALDRIDPGWAQSMPAPPLAPGQAVVSEEFEEELEDVGVEGGVPGGVVGGIVGGVVPVPAPAGGGRLAGSTWIGEETQGGRYEYTFHPDGTLEYASSAGRFHNGTWRQDGDSVYMEMNQKYAEREGKIRGDRMEGRGWNVSSLRWTWWANLRGGAALAAPAPAPAAAPAGPSATSQALAGDWEEYWDGSKNADRVRITVEAGGAVRLARGGSAARYSAVSFDGQRLRYHERDTDGESYEVTLTLETPARLVGSIVSDRRGAHRRELRRVR